ncbi:hypothetical protein [Paenibacillus sp. DCT19]|uniref:hypothetical protein n=1 Tax=Paenibacillus sp. DCT19 TaxID=2211212 RepID=UPI0020C562A6|nr:hypothetical protein [Paenibacillus sp. DCT19]
MFRFLIAVASKASRIVLSLNTSGMMDMLQVETWLALVVILKATDTITVHWFSYLDRSGYTYYMSIRCNPKNQARLGMVSLLLTMVRQLEEFEKQMEDVAVSLPDVELVKSIPGIGIKQAAVIVA